MLFESCSIIIPVIRETDLFEQVVQTILDTCSHKDLEEFIIVVHPERTASESYYFIDKMRRHCEDANIEYQVLKQRLPGMGGAVRDGIDIAKGSHTIFLSADLGNDPIIVSQFIAKAKKYPNDCINGSRYISGGTLGAEYKLPKKIWNFIANKGLHLLYPGSVTDYSSAIRCVPTELYHSMRMIETEHPWTVETTFKLMRLGVKFHEVPLIQHGGSQSGYLETLRYIRPMIYCRFMPKSKILKGGLNTAEEARIK